MKYKIEIWRYGNLEDEYSSNKIEDCLKWYVDKWRQVYNNGDCYFEVYEGKRCLDWNEAYKFGFDNYEIERIYLKGIPIEVESEEK